MKIIISGYGYVGKATGYIFKEYCNDLTDIQIQDPYLNMIATNWNDARYHIICVPTPPINSNTPPAGHDVSNIKDSIMYAKLAGFGGITVLRSTVSPLDLDIISPMVSKLLFWPEFLRKNSWKDDAVNPLLSIIGGEYSKEFQSDLPKYKMLQFGDARTACMAKLAINSYLSMRTIVASDIRKACDQIGLNWVDVKHALSSDPRLGIGHWDQPGPDGLWGYGGGCLPKDTDAMWNFMENLSIYDSFAEWASIKNKSIR